MPPLEAPRRGGGQHFYRFELWPVTTAVEHECATCAADWPAGSPMLRFVELSAALVWGWICPLCPWPAERVAPLRTRCTGGRRGDHLARRLRPGAAA